MNRYEAVVYGVVTEVGLLTKNKQVFVTSTQ